MRLGLAYHCALFAMEPQSPYCLCLGPCQKDTSPLLPRRKKDGTTILGPQITLHPEVQRHMSGLAQQSRGTALGIGYHAMWQIQRPLTFLRYQPSGNYTWICNTVLNDVECLHYHNFRPKAPPPQKKTSPSWYSQENQTPSNGSSFYRWKQPMCETSSDLVQSSGFSSNKKPHDLILLRAVGWFSLQKREP